MSTSNTQIAALGGLIIIAILGFQFLQIRYSQPIPDQKLLLAESGIFDELKWLKSQLTDINKNLHAPQEILNNHSIKDFVHDPVTVINKSAPYQELHVKHIELKKEIMSLKESIGLYENEKCTRQEHIYFLKTSKTGSTTIANMMIRFGLRKPGTNFLLGEASNGGLFFSNQYMPFTAETCFLGRDIEDRPKFDISYVHMRYNKTAIDMVMKPDTKKITILRDPLTNFVSSWRYYNGLMKEMRKKLPRYTEDGEDFIESKDAPFLDEIEEFLLDPFAYLDGFPFSHGAYMFTYHPQLVFFGYPTYVLKPGRLRLKKLVESWIYEIANDFDHILILEDLETSLAVMMIKFCWNIDDVAHLKLNSMRQEKGHLSKQATDLLQEHNWGDYMLYKFFVKRLKEEVQEIGEQKVQHYKTLIINRSAEFSKECLQDNPTVNELAWIQGPRPKPEKLKNQTCTAVTKDLTGFIIMEQLLRWRWHKDFFRNQPARERIVNGKSVALANGRIERQLYPKFCLGTKGFLDFMEKNERFAQSFFNYETNEWDIRPEWPDIVKRFSKLPISGTERSFGEYYRRIWNDFDNIDKAENDS